MYKNFYTTAMCPLKKAIERRFIMIKTAKHTKKSVSAISTLVAMLVLAVTVFASGVLANEIIGGASNQVIVSYNGVVAEFTNKPFIENGEIYLPLRETLNACGVASDDIIWDNGEIQILLTDPTAEIPRSELISRIFRICRVRVGDWTMTVNNEEKTLTHMPIMRNDTTYVPIGVLLRIKNYYNIDENRNLVRLGFLEELKVESYDGDGKKNVMISPPIFYTLDNCFDPKTYYESNEKVLIGTAKQQEEYGYYNPTDEVRNGKLIKRIIIDDMGEVIAVVPIENQLHETLDMGDISFNVYPDWSGSLMGSSFHVDAEIGEIIRMGIVIHEMDTENGNRLEKRAYIPIEYQIKDPNGEYYKDFVENYGKSRPNAFLTSFVTRLTDGGMFPSYIADGFTDFRTEELEDGSTLYLGSSWNDENDSFNHNIQMTVMNGNITYYMYRDYYFDVKPLKTPLTISQGTDLVKKFAKEFIPNGEKLVWRNEPAYSSIYSEGHVESWLATQKDGTDYLVMVDLDNGYVIRFSDYRYR